MDSPIWIDRSGVDACTDTPCVNTVFTGAGNVDGGRQFARIDTDPQHVFARIMKGTFGGHCLDSKRVFVDLLSVQVLGFQGSSLRPLPSCITE